MTYKFIRYCRLCKKKMVFNKGEDRSGYCDDCKKRLKKGKEEYEKNNK